jgi:hypothetical protein
MSQQQVTMSTMRTLLLCALLLLLMAVPIDARLIVRGGLGAGFSLVTPGVNNCTATIREAIHLRKGLAPTEMVRCDGLMEGIVPLTCIDSLMPDHIVHVVTNPREWTNADEQRLACIIMRDDIDACRTIKEPIALWCKFVNHIHKVGRRGRHVIGATQHIYTYEVQRLGQWKDPC